MSNRHSIFFALIFTSILVTGDTRAADQRFVQVQAQDRVDRSLLADLGLSIEAVRSDSVWGFASESVLKRIQENGLTVLGNFDAAVGRGGHQGFDFPAKDSNFHNYSELLSAMRAIQSMNPDITVLRSIGKSVEGRDLWALHINTTPESLQTGKSNKPGAIYMGTHHAREHVSTEMAWRWAEHLLKNREDPTIAALLDSRDIWIIPLVNPDGAEADTDGGTYHYWRKNRRASGSKVFGVDLNRNYGFKWGTGGSSSDTSSEVYKGTEPFSEPETQAVRDFVRSQTNTKVLLTFHSFSELILYPWGHTFDHVGEKIGTVRDYQVFKKMAETMAQWNRYTPQQASDMYIASGDTTDWAYGELGIFAFTFELSPNEFSGIGGFYPGQGILDRVFNDNLKPCLYLLDAADDPYKVLAKRPSRWLKSLVEPEIPSAIR
jgi:carboxypeptidase T